jgi:hypothetical protein
MIELPSIQKTLVPSAASTLGAVPVANVTGRAVAQALATQTPLHTVPQAPQLNLSVLVSAQMPPHAVSPCGQVWMHEPPEHTALPPAGDWQDVPQEPQLPGSPLVSTQLLPQYVYPVAH